LSGKNPLIRDSSPFSERRLLGSLFLVISGKEISPRKKECLFGVYSLRQKVFEAGLPLFFIRLFLFR
jgi:hypothetical protein